MAKRKRDKGKFILALNIYYYNAGLRVVKQQSINQTEIHAVHLMSISNQDTSMGCSDKPCIITFTLLKTSF